MSGTCNRTDCAVCDDMPCEMGVRDFRTCPHYQAVAEATAEAEAEANSVDGSGQRLPWSGRALGLADMTLASARSAARLVGVIGPFNAGKTGFLTAMFAHFAQTGRVAGHDFSGSLTLQGWIQLKEFTSWPSPHGGMFPPHTPDNGQRTPSLLHLALRPGAGRVRDLLFTDAPGEWFTRWLKNQAAEDAQGARWVTEHATHFIYAVDRAGLAGKDVGRIRQNTLALAQVLQEHRRGRPIIAIWTKSDDEVNLEVEAPIRERLAAIFGPHPSFNVQVTDAGCLQVLALLLADLPEATRPDAPVPAVSAFFAYQGGPS